MPPSVGFGTRAAAAASAGAARGGAIKGAAGGALAGVAIGAIAGDAGKGAAIGATSLGLTGGVRSRRDMKTAGGASDSAVAVDEDGTVGPPDLGERERPTFFRLDAGNKELTLLAPESRRGEVTKLDSVCELDGQHVFSGLENGRAVSAVITADGRMTVSIVADGVVWSVFGHALPEERSN